MVELGAGEFEEGAVGKEEGMRKGKKGAGREKRKLRGTREELPRRKNVKQ